MKNGTLKIVLQQTGSLLILLSGITLLPSLISVLYREWYPAAGFVLASGVIAIIGFCLYWWFKDAEEPVSSQALVIAAWGWLFITLMGALPFWVIAWITPVSEMNKLIPPNAEYTFSSLVYFRNYLHCFFESMSAYTTTGLSMAVHEPSVGKGVLFYRSLAQWFGGAGFIVMVLAVFKQASGKSALLLYGSESTGQKLKPRIIDTARAIWKVYLFITLFSTIYLIVGTWLILPDYPLADNIFDSINHAMAGQSTGGFSTLDDSIAGYHSVKMDILYLLPMILGSFSIVFFYKLFHLRRISEFWRDIQTRWLLIAFVFGSAVQSFLLYHSEIVPEPIREGVFQFISAMSTTGWQTSDIGNWDWLSVVFIVSTAMFVGGASGATVGGIKMIRALLIGKGLRWQINKAFLSEHTVKSVRFNGKTVFPEQMNEEFTKAASFAIMFFLLMIGSALIAKLVLKGEYSLTDTLFESASAQATVGLSAGITKPDMNPWIELMYIFQMWTGRLEIIPVFALMRALIWGTRPQKI